ncbi:Rad1/Rec1/Rad17 [Protomyces lactucae-debilis]|uniref:Rad1/Rec1/Rad17 n=1 Tax=Protomyces lactucae-debilis TaxID=2754530 RepID=A0A1Y2FBP0_PROLT|nr:Rad1/Rec1/Rad17 [Protomyces lactucae-debilis]ORY81037.1 Rad1/Rec1/Rad17 [Protomyces lactucae-debilis]
MDAAKTTTPLFSALAVSLKPLQDVLRCIHFKPTALCQINHEGIKISVEDAKSLQAHAFLDTKLFSTFNLDLAETGDEMLLFGISLAALMEMLNIYTPSSGSFSQMKDGQYVRTSAYQANGPGGPLRLGNTIRVTYAELGGTLDLVLEEHGVQTQCRLTTYEPDEIAEISLEADPVPDRIIMRSAWLYEALTELELHQGDLLTIRQSPRQPFLRLAVKGILGEAQLDYPNDKQVLETFSCADDVKHVYRFGMIKTCLKAMNLSTRVSIRTDDVGTMAIQFMIDVGDNRNAFVEFRMVALDENGVESASEDGDRDDAENRELDETLVF